MMQVSPAMAGHDIIVVAASAGGVEAVSRIVAGLPAELRAAVFVVLHVGRGPSVFPDILARAGRLPASHPKDGEQLRLGRIYVAPPDRHMTLDKNTIRITRGPTENGLRPAADPLFRSAARSFGPRVVGVVVSGSLDDGTAGLAAVKQAGGVAIVQDPEEAAAPGMPRNALAVVRVDHVLTLDRIPSRLVELTTEPASRRPSNGRDVPAHEAESGQQPIVLEATDRPGRLAVVTCPDCHGNLWEDDSTGVLRFRCRVGHAYSAESMLDAQTQSVDRALWAALRALEERAALTRKLADRASEREQQTIARAFLERADIAAEQAALVRKVLLERADSEPVASSDAEDGATATAPTPEAAAQQLTERVDSWNS
jgi:two-component system chemotaxis response regulator CheB